MEVDVQNIVENFDQVFADSGDEVFCDEIELERIESFCCSKKTVSLELYP